MLCHTHTLKSLCGRNPQMLCIIRHFQLARKIVWIYTFKGWTDSHSVWQIPWHTSTVDILHNNQYCSSRVANDDYLGSIGQSRLDKWIHESQLSTQNWWEVQKLIKKKNYTVKYNMFFFSRLLVSVFYYYSYKRAALTLGDPRFHESTAWLQNSQSQSLPWF